ncbi:MAG: anthranilate phosphoribosyltransferase [Candidatus Omnitrophica bacterium]|nr:anthranilate phosphoribosyltransferase [Candidatus Omnitrophota bacterium]
MIKEAQLILSRKQDLDPGQMSAVIEEIMSGEAETADIVKLLLLLNEKGETVEELAAAVGVMRRHAVKIETRHPFVLDTCGTGGDLKHTFNISTAAAFVVSGCGVPVAKHGNRSVSSKSGSADILEALGVNIQASRECVQRCLDEIGLAFLFAQAMHPAMKHAMPARRQVGTKTIFNFLGPLSNPAGASHQLVGVYDPVRAGMIAGALRHLETAHALIVCGNDGLDEVSTMDATRVFEVRGGELSESQIHFEDFGFPRARLEEISGGTAVENAALLREILKGKRGPCRDIVVLNAAAALYAADKTGPDMVEGIRAAVGLAAESIDSGKALEKLELLREYTHGRGCA